MQAFYSKSLTEQISHLSWSDLNHITNHDSKPMDYHSSNLITMLLYICFQYLTVFIH